MLKQKRATILNLAATRSTAAVTTLFNKLLENACSSLQKIFGEVSAALKIYNIVIGFRRNHNGNLQKSRRPSFLEPPLNTIDGHPSK